MEWLPLMFPPSYSFFQILEGRSYKLNYPWIGVVNRSQADINKSVDMIAARRRENEYFANTPEYRHLASRMGSVHLGKVMSKVCEIFYWHIHSGCTSYFSAKLVSSLWSFFMSCFQHLETVIKSRIPGLQSLINKTIIELETELTRIGKPIAADTGVNHLLRSLPLSPICFYKCMNYWCSFSIYRGSCTW